VMVYAKNHVLSNQTIVKCTGSKRSLQILSTQKRLVNTGWSQAFFYLRDHMAESAYFYL